MSDLSSPIKWHGGKHYLAPKLKNLLPPHVHRVYTHAGGISELFAWPHEGVSEVVNDLDLELTNFWKVMSFHGHFVRFERIVEAIPFSEHEFDEAAMRMTPMGHEPNDEVMRAVRFFVRCRQSRQGLMKDFATLSRNRTRRGMNEQVSAWLTSVDGLRDVFERLRRVVIRTSDANEIIRQQDGPNTFFYLDPPYLHETRKTTGDYKHEMSESEHAALLNVLSTIEGKFMLSGYPSALYESAELRNRWRHIDFELPNNASSKKVKDRAIERVWMNY